MESGTLATCAAIRGWLLSADEQTLEQTSLSRMRSVLQWRPHFVRARSAKGMLSLEVFRDQRHDSGCSIFKPGPLSQNMLHSIPAGS